MIIRFIFDILKQNRYAVLPTLKSLIIHYKYYRNLQRNLSSCKIYQDIKNQNNDYSNFLNELSNEDYEIFTLLFKNKIEDFLSEIKLESCLMLDKKIGISQVGHNTIYYNRPPFVFWTTGKATFYLPTKRDMVNKITIEILSIPPIKVSIGFENEIIKEINISALSTKKIEFDIIPSKILRNISEIFVATDKLWFPNMVSTEFERSVTLGIGIKSIQVHNG